MYDLRSHSPTCTRRRRTISARSEAAVRQASRITHRKGAGLNKVTEASVVAGGVHACARLAHAITAQEIDRGGAT